MQVIIAIQCSGCERWLGKVAVDTADMPEELQKRLNDVILEHRADCLYYGGQHSTKFSFGRRAVCGE